MILKRILALWRLHYCCSCIEARSNILRVLFCNRFLQACIWRKSSTFKLFQKMNRVTKHFKNNNWWIKTTKQNEHKKKLKLKNPTTPFNLPKPSQQTNKQIFSKPQNQPPPPPHPTHTQPKKRKQKIQTKISMHRETELLTLRPSCLHTSHVQGRVSSPELRSLLL